LSIELPIVDAHQHFWDPRVNYHPWLCDEIVRDFTAVERRRLFHDNAIRIYAME